MKINIDLSVIIPVHSVADPNFESLLNTALMSIENNEIHPSNVIIVRCGCGDVKSVVDSLNTENYSFNISVLENNTGKEFQNQINFAVSTISTKYFSFLEFDDEYSVKWFKNVKNYILSYPEIDMFIPIISDVSETNQFIGHSNEAAWAYNFSNTLGQLDNEVLLAYPNINPDGMVMNTEVFKEIGGYKPSIKLTFNYEMLLRFTNTGRNIMVIPKFGYKHMNMRPGSLFWNYKNSEDTNFRLEPDEGKFWIDVAQKEYFFTEDRQITYEKATV